MDPAVEGLKSTPLSLRSSDKLLTSKMLENLNLFFKNENLITET